MELIILENFLRLSVLVLILGLQIPNKGKIAYQGIDFSMDASEIITGTFISYIPHQFYHTIVC